MFKVNNKNTRTTSTDVVLVFLLITYFTLFSSVFVDYVKTSMYKHYLGSSTLTLPNLWGPSSGFSAGKILTLSML